jgi:Fur family transcriptional regulator, ferric uptake regulator
MASRTAAPALGRATRQAAAVEGALARSREFRSAQDIHAHLRRTHGPIGLATVYRRLQSLADANRVDVVQAPNGESLYRLCESHRHHHHLVCRDCGTAVEVEGRGVERWSDTVATRHGFADVEHVVELFGTCADCARRRSRSR